MRNAIFALFGMFLLLFATACMLPSDGDGGGGGDDDDDNSQSDGGRTPGSDAGSSQQNDATINPDTSLPGTPDTTTTPPNDTSGTGDTCSYPSASGALRVNEVWPEMWWNGAYNPDGSTTNLILEDIYCGRTATDWQSIVLVVGTGWCTACPDYMEWVDDQSAQLTANGALIVFLETETESFQMATNAQAHEHIESLRIDSGIRVGDADTNPTAGTVYSSPDIAAYPTAYVIRTEDMMIVADQGMDEYYLDLDGITGDINGTWTPGGTLEPNCGTADEESYEPNNSPAEASSIGATVIDGGVCDQSADFYQINISGDWQAHLDFTHSVGDLDMYIWNTSTDEPATDGAGNYIGSDTATDDEQFSYAGQALLMIYGYNRTTAPYVLTITEL